ncbi:conditioned medium-induced protein 4 [Halohasta litorea]|uniref:Conditioned medium-induced protein 4 n=1 Tax=Halohasta litorea TaxID=869891 RepID=A0ABD6DAI1_9EURY|nr:conditioned medium-induced protein 4 [Halohasta litorea]
MDDKTAELRDIFIDATGSDSVTESQSESPGSLTDTDTDVTDRLLELIGRMRERYGFETEFDDETLSRIVQWYYTDCTDREIAAELEANPEAVFAARLDLHLVDEADREAPFDLDDLRRLVVDDVSLAERAERLDLTEETARHYSRIVKADLRSTRANDRFRDEFAELLTDSDLTGQLARDAREDGLQEATEDIETDVSF